MENYLKVGTITQPFGIKGEMKVYPHTDDPTRFKKLKKVYIPEKDSYKEFEIESAKMSLPLVILKFRGIDTPEEIRLYKQKDIYVTREDAAPLSEGEYYFADILGMNVVDDEGISRGRVTDIIQTGANDVYEITADDGSSFLLPVIEDCLLNVDLEANLMTIHILEGLLD
ncbi:MAG: ribosome maturation factor RimM [Lachnospiraceae bacterium]|nr:ribosome maturation factor RimM [Lachnospiraceae bacterium]